MTLISLHYPKDLHEHAPSWEDAKQGRLTAFIRSQVPGKSPISGRRDAGG